VTDEVQKAFQTTLIGMQMMFSYRSINWTAKDFQVGEKVYLELDGTAYIGEVKSIASYGVDVVLAACEEARK
jgi:hypothetical protein